MLTRVSDLLELSIIIIIFIPVSQHPVQHYINRSTSPRHDMSLVVYLYQLSHRLNHSQLWHRVDTPIITYTPHTHTTQPLAPACASVTKQYNLVSANGRWCWTAGEATAGMPENNGSLPPRSPAGWLPRTGISSELLRSYWVWNYLS